MGAAKCTSLFGHKFVARYSVKPTRMSAEDMEAIFFEPDKIRASLTMPESIYECDVCIRCGQVAERPPKRS